MRNVTIFATMALLTLPPLIEPSHALDVIQIAEATLNGAPLFTQTGQVIDQQTCSNVVAQNLTDAPYFGYAVAEGRFTDSKSGITIRQSCITAYPIFERAPSDPISVAPDVYQRVSPVACPSPTRRFVLFTYGQSNGANNGEARYNASSHVFVWNNGKCYPAYDPLSGASGFDGSLWGRLGDRLVDSGLYDNVVIIASSIGGADVADWSPGGAYNALLTLRVQNAVNGGMKPDAYLVMQGEADVTHTFPPAPSTLADIRSWIYASVANRQNWRDTFLAGLATIRSLGIVEPAYVAKLTRCNLRDPNTTGLDLDKVIWRNPSYYVAKEKARIEVRAGQALVVNGSGVRAGPDIDALPPELSYDGCHRSRRGLDISADLWFSTLTSLQASVLTQK